MTMMLVVRQNTGPRIYVGKVVCQMPDRLVIELLAPDPVMGDSVEIKDTEILSRSVLAA